MRHRTQSRFAAWLLAAALVLVSGGAAAHELDHAFHKHDGACALHFFSEHSGKSLPVVAQLLAPVAAEKLALPPVTDAARAASPAPYTARAPPVSLS